MKQLIFSLIMLTSLSAFSQPNLTTKDILNKELTYNFGGFIIEITFNSDSTLYWKERNSGQDAHEKTQTFHMDDHTMITRWYGTDKTWVSLLSDFAKGETSRTKGTTKLLKGTIVLKK